MVCINDIFRSAYEKQGMTYEPIDNDGYEYDNIEWLGA